MMFNSLAGGYCRPLLIVSLAANIILITSMVVLEQRLHLLDRAAGALNIDIPLRTVHKLRDLDYRSVDGKAIKVHGIAEFDYDNPVYDRLAFVAGDLRPEIRNLATRTSGVRLRFRTDSRRLHFIARGIHPAGFSYPSLSESGSAGLDLFVEGKYVRTITLRSLGEVIDIGALLPEQGLASVELYLPLYSRCHIERIGFDRGSRTEPPKDFARRIAFYGTSITQGEAAPRPSLAFPAVVARILDADFYNFGFSGNAKGDVELADALGALRADLYVLEYSLQASDINGLDNNLIRFCTAIRKRHPAARILILTSTFDASERSGNQIIALRREAFFNGYKTLRESGADVYFMDGTTLLGPEDDEGLADGTHLNALGVSRLADRLVPTIRSILEGEPSG